MDERIARTLNNLNNFDQMHYGGVAVIISHSAYGVTIEDATSVSEALFVLGEAQDRVPAVGALLANG